MSLLMHLCTMVTLWLLSLIFYSMAIVYLAKIHLVLFISVPNNFIKESFRERISFEVSITLNEIDLF